MNYGISDRREYSRYIPSNNENRLNLRSLACLPKQHKFFLIIYKIKLISSLK